MFALLSTTPTRARPTCWPSTGRRSTSSTPARWPRRRRTRWTPAPAGVLSPASSSRARPTRRSRWCARRPTRGTGWTWRLLEIELRQVLDAGVPGFGGSSWKARPIKPDALLELAVRSIGDGVGRRPAELERVAAVASSAEAVARVAPRVTRPATGLPPTRFGVLTSAWAQVDWARVPAVQVVGVNHLHGYAAADRVAVLGGASRSWTPSAQPGTRSGSWTGRRRPPMSYLADRESRRSFWAAMTSGNRDGDPWITRSAPSTRTGRSRSGRLAGRAARCPWRTGRAQQRSRLASGLAAAPPRPGRSLLDGCGADPRARGVHQGAQRRVRAGRPGDEPDTGLRSTSSSFLVDPVLVRQARPVTPTTGSSSAPASRTS